MWVKDFHAGHGNNVHADDDDFEQHGYWQDLKASLVRIWNLVLPTIGKTITSKAVEKKEY